MDDNEYIDFYYKNIRGKRLSYVNNTYSDFIEQLRNRFKDINGTESIRELIYRIENKLEEIPKCVICGKSLKFINCKNSYQRKFCSKECEHSKEGKKITRQICFNTKLERYGSGYYNNREKYKQTNLERFGYENPNQNEQIKEKAKVKREKTIIDRYGVSTSTQLKEVKEKIKQTCLKKFGVEHPAQNEEIKKKMRETCIQKYGVENAMQCDEIKQKSIQTCIQKYGVSNPLKSDVVKEKSKQVCIEKYGIYNPMQCDKVKQKAKETCLRKYGVENVMQNREIMLRSFNNRYSEDKSYKFSNKENEIYDYLITIDKDTKRQYYSDLYPFHCDFYLPNFDVYIEYQGMWTHGKHPFNKDNEYDIELLNRWKIKAETSKFYKNAIKVWTVSDVIKRETAKINNLNYLEIFYNTESYKDTIDNYLNNLQNEN